MASATAQQNGKAIVPPDATTQASYSGTPRGPDGTSTPDDYAPKMANPVTRMEIFEEMGQADDQVRTGLEARRQEISAANWALSNESTASNATEILEFVEDNIYPLLDQLLRQLSGALQYGFAALEPVYQWSDRPPVSSVTRGKVNRAAKTSSGERIWLRKLAHLRQTGVYTFKIAGPNDVGRLAGDLIAVEQQVFDGASFRRRVIPAEKLLLWVYDKQGDDYWGVPPLRHCHKAWKYKSQIESLLLLHFDKFGVGTPVISAGEGANEKDRQWVAQWASDWRSGARNSLVIPKDWTADVKTATGELSGQMIELRRDLNVSIAKTLLSQGTELGSTDTGSRALGETFADQLSGAVQSDVEDIANLINNGIIVPMVRWNFGDQDLYPTFAPSQRVRAGTSIASILASLASAGAIHLRPEDEVWIRDTIEMPSVDLKTLEDEQAARDATAQAIKDAAGASPQDDAAGGQSNDKGRPAPNRETPPVRIAAHHDHRPRFSLASTIADGAPEPAKQYETSYRTPEFSAWEHGIVRPDVLSRDLDLQASRVTSETQDVLRAIDEELTRQVESLASKGAAALSAGIKGIAVPDRLRKQLRSVLLGAAQRARDYGAKAVMNEIERQLGPSAIGPQRSPVSGYFARLIEKVRTLAAGDDKSPEDIKLEATVDQAVEDEIDRREQSARSAASNAIHQAAGALASVLASVASTGAKDALIGLSPYRTQDTVEGVVNTGFGIGRSETAQEIASGGGGSNGRGIKDSGGNPIGLVAKVYSAVMDMGTCDECAKWDGGEFPIDYPEDFTGVQAPNPRCAGGYARCRCVWVYLTARESVPLVPASKGPQPIRRAA